MTGTCDKRRNGRITWLLILTGLIAVICFAAFRSDAVRKWRLERQSIEDLRAAAGADQRDVLMWSIYAEKLLKAGQGEEAASAYDRLIELLPSQPDERSRKLMADAAYALARFGTEQQAVVAVDRAARSAPESPRTLLAAGILAIRKQDFTGAQRLFQRVLNLSPSDSEAWNRLGTSYLAMEQPRLAEEPLRTAVRLNPNDAPSHADFGEALALQSRFREAAAEYATAERLAPNSADYPSQFALASASAAKTDDDYSSASALLATAMQRSPDDAALQLNLAGLQMRFARMDEARRTYESAVGRMPDNPDAWFNLSTVYTRLGDPDSASVARKRFQEILDRQTAVVELTKKTLMHPSDARLHAELSDAQKRAGDMKSSFQELQKAVELAPTDTKLRARLEEATRSMSGGPRPNGMRAN